MNLEELRKRANEIVKAMGDLQVKEEHTDEDVKQINDLAEEFQTVKAKIEAAEKIEAVTNAASVGTGRKVAPAQPVVENKKNTKNFGYKAMGDFFVDVKNTRNGGKMPDSWKNATAVEKVAEDGGYLVPADFMDSILKKVMSDDSLLSRTRQLTTTKNQLQIPVNETAPWDADGVQAYWEGEAETYQQSKSKFKLHDFRLHKLTAYVKVSEELLDDAPALEAYMREEAREAIFHKINTAILVGDGSGKPKGILNSDFKVTVPKEVGQAAGTVVFENIVKMYSRMLPQSRGNAVWIIHPEVEEQLRLMKFDTGAASPVPAYLPPGGLSDTPYGTLMGRPVIPMMGATKALGSEGDILFVDFSKYYTVMKSGAGLESFMSTHVHFDADITAFKFRIRLAGNCPFTAPVSTENGSYVMSGLVSLAVRA